MWAYNHKNPERTYNCCGKVNRGLAILGNRLFMGTLDMHLIALDAKSGRELWKTEMFDYTASGGYAATGAPLALRTKSSSGWRAASIRISGFLDAYDAATGKRVWRFNTIPQPGEANFGTWDGDSWKTGGVATWNNGSYDPETNTVFWGTSNPWPDYNGDFRKGDNLYSCSVSLSMPTPASSSGITSSPRTTPTTGTPPRSRSCSTPPSGPRPQADGMGGAQRLLLPPRPERRPVPSGEELRPPDMG